MEHILGFCTEKDGSLPRGFGSNDEVLLWQPSEEPGCWELKCSELASPKPLCSSQLSSARNLCAKEIETCLENKLFPLTFPLGRLGEAEPISCFMIKKELRTLLWKFNTTISYRNKMVHYLCSPKLFYSQLSKYLLTF